MTTLRIINITNIRGKYPTDGADTSHLLIGQI